METHLPRSLGRFAAFFTVALPAFAALAAAALHKPFVGMVGERGAANHWLAGFYFNHFAGALAIPAGVAALTGTLALFALRRKDASPVETLGRLMVLLTLAAMVATTWLAGFLFAAVLS